MNPFAQTYGSHGFGSVESFYSRALAAQQSAYALPNIQALLDQQGQFASHLYNLNNHLSSAEKDGWSDSIPVIEGFVAQYPAASTPSQLRPDLATIVRTFYTRYLPGDMVDQPGVDFWTGVAINNGADGLMDVEEGFRVQAVNDGKFTAATLPAPQYFTIVPDDEVVPVDQGDDDAPADDGGNVPVNDTTPVVTTPVVTTPGEPGILDGLLAKVSEGFNQLSESTGVDKQYLQIGAAGLLIGGVFYLNSQSGKGKR
jgi:hypothetical protein